ncbi:ABC transporter ATP-binding protein [Schumannella luteola]|uniref:Branched-chain amino acid transport system ATP-binding protein n=1 Tax=Schumannella luteola TaxID=472059 RepID=A0A852YBF9_9MICO|nr:ATP-binding cassette domain-containing protein [Schumannella luteola]NYG98531.1 branched-chain amino acid transport system ATP-binding protein [Schumannella luteola]TPX01248.1 ATP-binding cassette domain-containing protein [Schumannella luteola]
MSENTAAADASATGEVDAAATATADALLSVDGLERHFDGVRAVDGVSFTVAPHEVVSIIGPNGSGKTTTLNLVSGALRAGAGTISLEGRRIDHADPARIAEEGVARTFQNGRVFATLSVRDNVEVGLHSTLVASRPFRRLSRLFLLKWVPLLGELFIAIIGTPASRREQKQIDAAVESEVQRFEARLGPRRDDPAYSLSYANRRRTEIARALALQPKLLLLDEPTAGMNQSETAEVLEQLLQLKADGQAILLVEHKLDLVMTVSDRVIVMDGGRIIAEGPPQTVRHDPAVIEAYLGRRRGLGGGVDDVVSSGDAVSGDAVSGDTTTGGDEA